MAECTCSCQGTTMIPIKKCKCDCTGRYRVRDLRMTWRVGTSPDYFPFEFVTDTDEITGFEIELIQLIAKKLDYKVELVSINFDSLIDAISVKYIDVIASAMTPTVEREQSVDFTSIFFDSEIVILTRKNVTLNQLSDLNNKNIGVQTGTIQLDLLVELQDDYTIEVTKNTNVQQLIELLATGVLDGVVLIKTAAEFYANENQNLVIAQGIGALGGETVALGVPKGSTLTNRINEILRELEGDGTLEKLILKWFGDQLTR